MKNLVLIFSALILGTSGIMATGIKEDKVAIGNAYRYNNSFIFVEDGITFAVFPDGEFDFYIENNIRNYNGVSVTFNSGYDYSPYAQYDDYGAVIQVENIPIYYDFNGRVTQIGNVDISYNRGRVFRLGGMYVYYNNRGFYNYHTGYINVYNRYYNYAPFHAYFARPALGFCLVYSRPYRRYYAPIRYTYYSPYRYNQRRAYATIGHEHRYNTVRNERATIYRNDKRVAVREDLGRRTSGMRTNNTVARSGGKQYRNSGTSSRNELASSNRVSQNNTSGRTVSRSNTKIAGTSSIDRSKRIESREITRSDARSTVPRSVSNKPDKAQASRINKVAQRPTAANSKSRTVSRSTNTYKAPARSAVPSRSQSTVSRNATSGSKVAQAPARSSRSNGTASTRSRSSKNK